MARRIDEKEKRKKNGENGCMMFVSEELLGEYHVTCNQFGGKKAYSRKQARTGTRTKGCCLNAIGKRSIPDRCVPRREVEDSLGEKRE